jgi:hypothetical protein
VVIDFLIAHCIIFISVMIIGLLTSPPGNTKRKSMKAIYIILRNKTYGGCMVREYLDFSGLG